MASSDHVVIGGERLTLAPVPDGSFDEYPAPYLSEVLREGNPALARQAHENVVVWDRFDGGVGQEAYDEAQSNRPLLGLGVDTSGPTVTLSLLVQDATITGLTATPSGFAAFAAGRAFMWSGTKLWTTTTGTSWGSAVLTTANPILSVGELNGAYVVCCGSSEFAYYSADGSTWTQYTSVSPAAAAGKPDFVLTSRNNAGAPVLAAVYDNGTVRTSTDAASTATPTFSGATTVCSTTARIASALVLNGLIVAKTTSGGLYTVDVAQGTVRVLPLHATVATVPDPTLPAAATAWLVTGAGYFAHNYRLLRFETDMVAGLTPVDPTTRYASVGLGETTSELRGRYVALLPHDKWLFCLLKTNHSAPRYHLLKYEERGGRGLFHAGCYLGTNACEALGWFQPTSAATNAKLLVGKGTGVGYIVLPVGSDNALQDESGLVRFVNQGALYLPRHNGRGAEQTKYALSATAIVEDLDNAAGTTVSPFYQLHTETAEGTLTHLGQVVTSGDPLVYPNDDTTDSHYKHIHLGVTLTTGDATTTPQLLVFKHEYGAEEFPQYVHELKLLVNPERTVGQSIGTRELFRLLRKWLRNTAPVRYVDPDGTTHFARVLRWGRSQKVATDRGKEHAVYYVPLVLKVFRPGNEAQVYWDQPGVRWDGTGVNWG